MQKQPLLQGAVFVSNAELFCWLNPPCEYRTRKLTNNDKEYPWNMTKPMYNEAGIYIQSTIFSMYSRELSWSKNQRNTA